MMCGCLQDITALLLSRSSVPIVGLWNCRTKVQNIDNNIDYQMYLPLSLFSLSSCLLPRIRRTCIEPIKITSVIVE